MTGELNFWNSEVWTFVITISVLLGSLMLANMLRRMIPFLRKSMLPSSVLAGFIVLGADYLYKRYTGGSMFSIVTLEALTYHGLGLGIVAMSLRAGDKKKRSKTARRDIFNSGLLTVSGYLIQGVIGLIITIGLYYLVGSWPASGILLPMGYGQGPGQAYNWGLTFMNQYGFEHGSSFGLSIAAMGFVAASIGGVIRLNIARRKGEAKSILNADEVENLSAESITTQGEIPLSESMDKLTVQLALIFIAYIGAYGTMWALTKYCFDPLGGFLQGTVKPLLWGFNFLVGMLFAFILKGILKGGRKIGIVKREYRNTFLLSRLSGLMFDIMVVSSIAAIDLSAFKYREFLLPLSAICIVGGLASYFFVGFICKRLFKEYDHEQFLAFFGMLTGTASTGLILLREIDPLYETPAADNLIKQNLWAIIFGAPMLLLMGYVATALPLTAFTTLGLLALMLGMMLLILFRSFMGKKKAAKAGEEESADGAADGEPKAE